MIDSLLAFVERLRGRGVSVSPAEAIDAARASAAVGPERRERLRAALSMTLAKDLRSAQVFDETFESFFVPPARVRRAEGRGESGTGGGSGGSGPAGGPGRRENPRADEEPPRGTGRSPRPPARAGRARPGIRVLRGDDLRRVVREGDPPADRGNRPDRKDHRRLATPRGASGPVGDRRRVQGPSREGARSVSSPGAGRVRLSKLVAAPAEVEERETRELRRRDLASSMSPEEEARLAREIPRIIEEIRLRHSRRMRRAPRGRLWMKRAIRENLSTGGVPFRLPLRSPKKKRPRVVLLVDVSWSTARAAGLFLQLALEFLRLDGRTSVFFFIDHPVDATPVLRPWLRRSVGWSSEGPPARKDSRQSSKALALRESRVGQPSDRSAPGDRMNPVGMRRPEDRMSPLGMRGSEGRNSLRGRSNPRASGRSGARTVASGIVATASGRSFMDVIESLPGLDPGAASDYGRTFYALASGPLRGSGRDTLLVVLGDARSNFHDPLEWAFEEIASRSRRVLWLVPEPRARWGTADSVLPRYLVFCDVAIEARDLEGLAHGVRELLGSL